MKKALCLFFVGCSILFLTGCNQKTNNVSDNTSNNTQNSAQKSDTKTVKQTEQIDIQRAKEIALSDAGFSENDVTDMSAELDDDDNKFDISFKHDGKEYDYDIDSTTGNIIKKDVENDD